MGMAFFVASGTFNPLDYGLSVGDIVNVIAVGGGGSGSAYSGNGVAVNGASGGASSFGAFLTAAGGGGATQQGGSSTSGDGQYLGGMANTSGSLAGGGAGGWIPGFSESGGHGGPGLTLPTVAGFTLQIPIPAGTAGLGGFSVSTAGAFTYMQNNKYVMPNYPTYINSGTAYAQLPPAGTCSGGGAGRGNLASLNSANYISVHRNGAGGSGYGAGGGGGTQGAGGGAGYVKQTSIKLTGVSPIAVTVGGGASPAFARYTTAYHANPGGAGFGGAAPYPGTGAGGYNGNPGGTCTINNNSANFLYDTASGGGAGGCVMVLW